jgi:Flp pilus assembly protein TadG
MATMTLQRDDRGALLVEVAVLLPIVITVLFGSVDLLYAFYQWNAAAKAVAVGARIAAVSDPVAAGLNNLSNQALFSGWATGSPMPGFTVICDGEQATCTCAGACTGLPANSYNSAAMNRIVFGRHGAACRESTSYYTSGMCDVLPSITTRNVVVKYQQSGLGYAGRPGGPVPTITVSLQNMKFQLFFLRPLLGATFAIPAMTTTITGEDLCSGGSNGSCGS